MVKYTRSGTSFSGRRDDLLGSRFAANSNAPNLARSFEASGKEPQKPSQRASQMVANDTPHPYPHPSPDMAAGVDAQSFNTRWAAEHRRAAQHRLQTKSQGAKPMAEDTSKNTAPSMTLRDGTLKAAIWRNESQNGAFHSVTVSRGYKDKEGNWKDTNTFRAQDMLGLSELMRSAHHHVHDLDRDVFKEQRRSPQVPSQTRDQSQGR